MVALDRDVWAVVASCAMAVCTALCSGLAGVLLARYMRARQHLAQFPGPTPRFLLGNLAMLIGEGGKAMPLFRLHHMLHRQYGSIVRFTMGSTPVLVISDIKAMKEVLVTKWRAFRGRPDFIMPVRGARLKAMAKALVFSSASSAYGQRSSALPAFHSTSLAKASGAVADAMLRMCDDIADRLSTSGSCGSSVGDERQGSSAAAADRGSCVSAVGQPFNLIPIAQRATMAAAFERALGIPFPDSAEPVVEAAEAFFHMTKMTDLYALVYLNMPDWTRPALCWLSSHLNVEAARFSSSLDTTFSIVQQLAEAYAAANPDLGIDTTPDKELLGDGLGLRLLEDDLTPSADSMLANFLRTKDKDTGKLFRVADAPAFLWSFLNAAYDTTASTIAFCTHHLAQSPEALRMLREEIAHHGADALPAAGSLSDWPVAQACVNETLRLHPFVLPFRNANADTTIQGKPVPRGTMVQVAIGVMHRDPEHFPDPDAFVPRRFLDGLNPEAAKRYQPFGMGPRGCLGYRLAVLEAVVAVVSLHQRFDFNLSTAHHADGCIDVDMPGLMRPSAGLWVHATEYKPPPQAAPLEQAQHAQHAAQQAPCDSAPATQHAEVTRRPRALLSGSVPALQQAERAAQPPPSASVPAPCLQQAESSYDMSPFATAPMPQHAERAAYKSPFVSVPVPQHAEHAAQKLKRHTPPQGLFSGKHRSLQTMLMLREQHSMHRSLSGHSMGRSYSGHCG